LEASPDLHEGDLKKGVSFELRFRDHRSTLTLEGVRMIRGAFVLAFRGCDSIDRAYRLVGHDLWGDETRNTGIPERRSPLGFGVVDTKGNNCGIVVEVHRGEFNSMLELEFSDRRILVPWHPAIVVAIDEESEEVVISPPEGLMDLNQ